jgi:hypothetical protein
MNAGVAVARLAEVCDAIILLGHRAIVRLSPATERLRFPPRAISQKNTPGITGRWTNSPMVEESSLPIDPTP